MYFHSKVLLTHCKIKESYLEDLINDYKTRISKYHKIEIIEYLLQKGSGVNEIDNNGKSALAYAIEFKSIPLINILIKYGADVNFVDTNKNCPLHYAIEVN